MYTYAILLIYCHNSTLFMLSRSTRLFNTLCQHIIVRI